MKFQYFEIRPCVDDGEDTRSFLGEPEFHSGIGDKVCTPEGALAEAEKHGEVFWTIYGRDTEGLATAVGDFKSFEDAYEIMNAILAPMAEARDALDHHLGVPIYNLRKKMQSATATLEDFINQCSNDERL